MLSLLLTACGSAPPPHVPGPWTPTPIGGSAHSGDTGAVDTLVSPSGWGTCATLRSALGLPSAHRGVLSGVAAAPDGGQLVTGWTDGPLPLDPGGSSDVTLVPAGEDADFVARYDPIGALGWVAPLQGTQQATIAAIAALPGGAVAVAGSGDGLSTFAGIQVGGLGEADAFVAVVGPDGAPSWLRSFGGAAEDDALALAVLPDGGLIVGATIAGDASVDGTPLTVPPGLDQAAVVARFAPDGAVVWARSFAGTTSLVLADLAYDPVGDMVLVLGEVDGEGVIVLAGERIDPLGDETFLLALGPDGGERWVVTAGGEGVDAVALDVVPGGGVVATGILTGNNVFGREQPNEEILTGPEYTAQPWVARYDVDGKLRWVSRGVSPEGDHAYPHDVLADPDGGAVLVGSFYYTVVFGDGEPARTRFVNQDGAADAFLARFGPDGALTCALQLVSAEGPHGGGVTGLALAARADGGLDLAGGNGGTLLLGEGASAFALTSEEWSGFLATLDGP